MNNILTSWKTTILGVIAIILAVLPVIQTWIQDTVNVNISTVILLIVGVMGALTKDAGVTGVK